MSNDRKQTVIENGTEFDGSIRSQCPISLSGKVKGQLHAPTLHVTSTGTVEGRVEVTELRSEGEVAGEIHADTVELAGRVSDKTVINAQSLEVRLSQPGGGLQVTFGNCELRVGANAKKAVQHPLKVAETQKTRELDKEPVL